MGFVLHPRALHNQNLEELRRFGEILRENKVSSYLEIGCKLGGSLWFISDFLQPMSKIVALDLPWGDRSTEPFLRQTVHALRGRNFHANLILGDSTDENIIAIARAAGPYDAVFIDANHTEPYVRKDWQNYGPMGRIVAFHDIGFRRIGAWPPHKMPIDVPKVWSEIKVDYRHKEIRLDEQDNGIGVLWR